MNVLTNDGKKWKPSTQESRESLIVFVNDLAQIPTKLEHLKEKYQNLKLNGKCLTLQPLIIIFGEDKFNLHKFVVHMDDVYYEAPTLLQALRICFMIYFTIHVEYPIESSTLWQFIQRYYIVFYNYELSISIY